MRNYNGMADYLFVMTESDFVVKTIGFSPSWWLGYNFLHCGFIVCKSVHNTPADHYWSHRNRWLAGNAEVNVMAWSYYPTFD